MKIRRLQLKNFRRYESLDLEFPEGVTALVGANGAGKSTLLEAILFALYGTKPIRTNKLLVRHNDAPPGDSVEVTLELELEGHAIRIERSLRGKNQTPQGTLEVDGTVVVPPGPGSMAAVDESLQQYLRIDLDGFRSTVVAQQKDLGRLSSMTASERKQRILSMLGVDRLDAAIASAREERKKRANALAGMRSMLSERAALVHHAKEMTTQREIYAEQLEQAKTVRQEVQTKLEGAQNRATSLEKKAEDYISAERRNTECRHALANAKTQLNHAKERFREAEMAQQRADALRVTPEALADATQALEQARTAETVWKNFRDADARLQALRKRLAAAEKQVPKDDPGADPVEALDRQRAVVAGLQERLRQHQNRHERLAQLGVDAPCPTCERPLTEHLPNVLKSAATELEATENALANAQAQVPLLEAEAKAWRSAAEARAEVARISTEVAEAESTMPPAMVQPVAIDPLEQALRALRQQEAKWAAARDQAKDMPARKARLLAAEVELEKTQLAASTSDEALEKLPNPHKELMAARADVSSVQHQLRGADQKAADLAGTVRVATAQLESAEKQLREDEARRQKVKEAEEQLRYWTALAGQHGGGMLNAFRDHLADRIGPAIQRNAGYLLGIFTDGRYNEIVLDSNYNLYVADAGQKYELTRFSGGEADVVHLALRLAVSRLLAERSGTELRFLALDEVFGSLDADRRRHVINALQKLSGLYAQVLVVTHLDELRDALDNTLEVKITNGSSVLHAHNG